MTNAKQLIFLLFLGILCSCNTEPIKIERPLETWTFRSVLDEQPRMLTAALHENLWVAYNTQTATLYKAWKGGVLFDGAVYTTQHGPQPTSLGYAYYQTKVSDSWILLKDDKEIAAKITYLGHQFEKDALYINFELQSPEGDKIRVTESPEYENKNGQSGIIRNFKVENNSSYTVGLRTTIASLQNESDYETNGEFRLAHTEKKSYPNGSLMHLEGLFVLNAPSVYLSNTFHPGFDDLALVAAEADKDEGGAPANMGAVLIEKSDCVACHNETLKTVGPSYLSIARKYSDDETTVKLVASRVIEGSKGIWGEAQMTAHPDLMEDDAAQIVRYILSLDDKEETTFDKNTLGIKSIPLVLEDAYTASSGKGLMVNMYYDVGPADILNVEENYKPAKQGPAAKLHALTENDFGEQKEFIASVCVGSITIDKTDNYNFRLISDDGSYLYIDDKLVIDNSGSHGAQIVDGEVALSAGKHRIKILYQQGQGGAFLSWQWYNKQTEKYELVDDKVLSFEEKDIYKTVPYVPPVEVAGLPGDGFPLEDVHPSFDLFQARPNSFKPKVGGIDFLDDGRMVVSSWEADGPIYLVDNWQSADTTAITVKKIASGLAEPLGLKVVNNEIYVLQKQELTKLIDHNGDDIIDEYRTHSYGWKVSANFHEFAFGLVYKDGYFYATLATAILPGGASAQPQISDRGKVVKISEADGSTEFIAHGLRTPNGIGIGVDEELFVADNQGDWLPASKIVHVQKGAFFGSRSVNPEGTEGMQENLPVVWLPQDEIGNSPGTPMYLDKGPYKGQMMHGEVTHGGIKRVFVEKINEQYQGVVFRFIQGLEAGVNRIIWGPDGSLLVGGVGAPGNWGHSGKLWYGLQRLQFNEKSTFEMLAVRAFTNGFEIEFTAPLAENKTLSAADFTMEQWYYKPTAEYGGPKIDLKQLQPKNLTLSADRKRLHFELPGMLPNHMVYFKLNSDIKSSSGEQLWSTEAWYTLNQIPKNKPIN